MPYIFIVILASYLLGNIYVFTRGLQAIAHAPLWLRSIYIVVFWACVLLIVVMMLIRNSRAIAPNIGHILFLFGSGWLVFMLYMVIGLAITDLIRVFNHSFHYGFITALILTVGVLIYGYWNYQHPVKQVIDIDINKLSTGCDGLKIVAISDLHLGLGTDRALLRRTIAGINAEKPDIILIGGDLIDNSIVPVIKLEMWRELNELQAPQGIFMALGNHDYISGIDKSIAFIREKTNICLLRDSVATLPCGLQIMGRDDRSHKRLPAEDLQLLVDASKPLIIIDHQPVNLDEAERIGVDLQFSGHTHHGQVIPISWLTDKLFELSYGYQKRGVTHYYVSSGIAIWGPPFRIGTNSEYVVFRIFQKKH
ncbi:MAG: metallophosphoesterase [Tannerella sp.]|jgi:predicted MPP superfamily phosphohydrolase|nr:metallophosphoesterase [Tannerella sp.]